jgi:hypothetical protein
MTDVKVKVKKPILFGCLFTAGVVFYLIGYGALNSFFGFPTSWGSIEKDRETGCQYIVSLFGSSTPRLDATGKIICVKPNHPFP